MSHSLSQDCIRAAYCANTQQQFNDGAVVQVLEVKKIEPKAGQTGERYRLVISDSVHYIQAMLATQLNDWVTSGRIAPNAIIRLTEYLCNEISGRKVVIILNAEFLEIAPAAIGDPANMQTASLGVPQAFGGVKAEQKRTQPTFMSKGGGGGGGGMGGYGAAPAAAAAGAAGSVAFWPISSLHPHVSRWTIKARVTAKSEKRTWHNAKGEGSLFSVDLIDASGGQIKATMFKDALEKFYDLFQENQVYIISKGQLKPANKKFSRLPNEYELTLNADAEIQLVDDDQAIQQHSFEFISSIEALQRCEPLDFADVIGVLTNVAPLSTINSKAGQELKKRALTIIDQSLCQVEVTLWGEQAEKYDEGTLANNPVIAIKSCKVSDFGGRSLSSSFQSQVFLNPDIPQAHTLSEWYQVHGAALNLGQVQNLSKLSRGGGGEGGGAGSNIRKFLSDIKEEKMGMGDKPDFFTVRATITYFKHDWEKGSMPWYMACPTPNCNKKVTEDSGQWHCEKCQRSFPAASPRYILSLMVCDPTGSTWLTAFNDAAQALLGGTTAEQLNTLVTSDQKDQASSYFKQNNFREYLFKIRAKAETGSDQEVRVRAHILSAIPVDSKNLIAECNYLFDEIAKYDI